MAAAAAGDAAVGLPAGEGVPEPRHAPHSAADGQAQLLLRRPLRRGRGPVAALRVALSLNFGQCQNGRHLAAWGLAWSYPNPATGLELVPSSFRGA